MRLTQTLYRQHLGFAFKRNWIFQRAKRPRNMKCEEYLKERGIEVFEANKYILDIERKAAVKKLDYNIKIVGAFGNFNKNEINPLQKTKACYVQEDKNVLLEGLVQAQIITKTHVMSSEQLPDRIEDAAQEEHPEEIHNLVKKIIMSSNVYDCQQEKLPKIKDPEKPAHIFKRALGITDVRKNMLMTTKLVNLLEKASNGGYDHKWVNREVETVASFVKEEENYQMKFTSNALITADKPLEAVNKYADQTTLSEKLPSLYPMTYRISLPVTNLYEMEDVYPIKDKTSRWYHPHTTILHYNGTQVGNLHGSPVTETQKWGRGLMHSFTIASTYAKSIHGSDVKLLPEPVVIQCVQTDGCNFYLGVFQLNSLDLNGEEGVKNLWYQSPVMRMYDNCMYLEGRPYLDGYNPTVYNYLSALYKNI